MRTGRTEWRGGWRGRGGPIGAAVAAVAVVATVAGTPGTAAAGSTSPSGGPGTPPAWLAAKDAALAKFTPPPPAAVTLGAPQAGPGYTTQPLSATVHVGPGRATTCPIVGELVVPDSVSASTPAAAVLTTNGFGGSYNDSSTLGLAEQAATDGFVVLDYSGLGFGGSGCQIDLDAPDTDGMAASELISWLGEQPEVLRDGPDDPRVGFVGGSYGGEISLATASVDPRLDAIVPVITWNDLAYSLAPNNDTTGEQTDAVPGLLKWEWATLFFADGLITPLEQGQLDRVDTCPGFVPAICQAFLSSVALGYPDPATVALLRSDSMVSYWQKVHVPVLLAQGEDDSLFDIQEAVDNLHELQADGDPVTLVLQSWGHSNSTAAPGELSSSAPYDGYENVVIKDFFDKWLVPGDAAVSPGPAVQYFRPWVTYGPGGTAAPAYGTAASWPVGTAQDWYLSGGTPLSGVGPAVGTLGPALSSLGLSGTLSTVSGAVSQLTGTGSLVPSAAQVVPGTEAMANPGGGIGTSYSETSGVQTQAPFSAVAPADLPGTTMSWMSPPLTQSLDVVGVPTLKVTVDSAVPGGIDPSLDPVVVAKLYDVAPSGTVTLVDRLVSPVRIATPGQPVTITLPGQVHQYPAGDRMELVLAAGDLAYLGNRAPDVLSVTVGTGNQAVLALPVVAPADQRTGGPLATGL